MDENLTDCFGNKVRLTAERQAHSVLTQPQLVRHSHSDATVRRFYEFCARTILGDKWMCVVVKYAENDAFVVTAYLTENPSAGENLWPTK